MAESVRALGPPLLIIGAGPLAESALDIFTAATVVPEIRGFLRFEDGDRRIGDRIGGVPVLDGFAALRRHAAGLRGVVLAVSSPAAREEIIAVLHEQAIAALCAVHPTVGLPVSAHVAPGGMLQSGSVLGAGARIGVAAIVGAGAVIGAGAHIADYAGIGAGARIGGRARVGERATIGAAASVLDGVAIGRDASIGSGAVVAHDVAQGVAIDSSGDRGEAAAGDGLLVEGERP